MVTWLVLAALVREPVERTPAAYWFPAAEGIEKWLPGLVEQPFDTWIADPEPNQDTQNAAKGQVKFAKPSDVVTKANMKWRDATIDFILGKTSPKKWLAQTTGLGETYHFLTTPGTTDLRSLTLEASAKLGVYSSRAVLGEMLLLYWPGKPCLYASDVGLTRWLPEDEKHQSWMLAMNDLLGPMLSLRAEHPAFVKDKPVVLRADDKPGLLVFRQKSGGKVYTFYINNGDDPIHVKEVDADKALMIRGLDVDTSLGPDLLGAGTLILETEK